MHLRIITVSSKMPHWVEQGYEEYAKRLGRDLQLELIELKQATHHNLSKVERLKIEADRILNKISTKDFVIIAEVLGHQISTEHLAKKLETWQDQGFKITLIIGGPDGLDPRVSQRANFSWSLSPLAFPHTLVRVMIIEQVYRALSILKKHPYHRA